MKRIKLLLILLNAMILIYIVTPLKAMDENDEENKSTSVKFAVIGDYGTTSEGSQKVSNLIKSWDPEFIITTGDNHYGKPENIDQTIGFLYSEYIIPYNGEYTKSPVTNNRFWPCLGNHDFQGRDAQTYLSYFNLPDNGYYYDVIQNNVHLFSVCSDRRCPDGISPDSKQFLWLKKKIQESQQPWKIVYYHHPTYSSRVLSPGGGKWPPEYLEKNSERKIDLPFSEWGVSAVLSGHLHLYERFDIKGIPYITNGLGGDEGRYTFADEHPAPESIVRFSGEDGAMLIEATDEKLSFKFITTSGNLVDHFFLRK